MPAPYTPLNKGTALAIAVSVTMPTDLRTQLAGLNDPEAIRTAVGNQFNLAPADAARLNPQQLLDSSGNLDTSPRSVALFISAPMSYTGSACPTPSELSAFTAGASTTPIP